MYTSEHRKAWPPGVVLTASSFRPPKMPIFTIKPNKIADSSFPISSFRKSFSFPSSSTTTSTTSASDVFSTKTGPKPSILPGTGKCRNAQLILDETRLKIVDFCV